MGKMKGYAYYKTAAKTARVNNLTVAGLNGKILFDFSLLDEMEISEREKETIKEESFIDDNIILHYCGAFYCKDYNQFECCVGKTYFNTYRINNAKSGKLLYRVFQLVGVDHVSQERASVCSDYQKMPCKNGEFSGMKFELDI